MNNKLLATIECSHFQSTKSGKCCVSCYLMYIRSHKEDVIRLLRKNGYKDAARFLNKVIMEKLDF